jgi:mono/diheme cytochrome c family protein
MRIALVLLALVVTAPAEAGVRVVAPFDPAEYADRAAVGLLVPGAGPTVTREAALAALVRGKLEHDFLGGIAPGEPRIELGATAGPEILVSLPPPGRSENDRRYPIALLGERGLLTSDSTRIDGLVSITDVATGRLRVIPNDEPAEALETLDDRIDRNDRVRLPLTIALAALLIGLALVRPQLAVRALLVALAANLWLDPAIAVAAGAAAIALPLGLACTAILAAYLVSMGLDPETVALSPFGPSQSGRFHGVNNLLETMLLVPALVGAARLGRAGIAVAALAFVTIGGARFGADGGGIVVLAVAYLVLVLRLRGSRPTPQLVAAVTAGAVAFALLLLAVDAATGGSSHVTDAVGDGPFALARDIADRIELSVRRTAAGIGATAVVLGSVVTLIFLAFRTPRDAVLDAFLAALAVSLVVNDTPDDVLGMGAAIAIALARHSPLRGALSSRSMRHAVTLLALLTVLAVPVGLAGCGGGEEVSPTPETVVGSLPAATTAEDTTAEDTTAEETTTEGSGSELKGDPANGEKVFASAGCGGCHTLEAAGSSGNVGPNLDDAKPDLELAHNRVTNGAGAMPAFKGQLSDQEIADVAAYVVESTQG